MEKTNNGVFREQKDKECVDEGDCLHFAWSIGQ